MYLNTLQHLIRSNSWFFIPYAIVFISALILQFTVSQFNITLAINGLHNPLLDSFFYLFTHVGDGLFAAAISILFLLVKRGYFWSSLLCFYVPALITQFLKHMVFTNHFRPSRLMNDFTQLHYVPGVEIHSLNSFPSGHTTSAFTVFLFLALLTSNKKWGIVFLLIAALVGISRIYLLQHFFQDVLFGSFIGVVCCTLIYTIFETYRAKLN